MTAWFAHHMHGAIAHNQARRNASVCPVTMGMGVSAHRQRTQRYECACLAFAGVQTATWRWEIFVCEIMVAPHPHIQPSQTSLMMVRVYSSYYPRITCILKNVTDTTDITSQSIFLNFGAMIKKLHFYTFCKFNKIHFLLSVGLDQLTNQLCNLDFCSYHREFHGQRM